MLPISSPLYKTCWITFLHHPRRGHWPDLLYRQGRLSGFIPATSLHSELTRVLYAGDGLNMAQQHAERLNAEEIQYWDEQQRQEIAAEARNKQGDGLLSFQIEEEEGRRAFG